MWRAHILWPLKDFLFGGLKGAGSVIFVLVRQNAERFHCSKNEHFVEDPVSPFRGRPPKDCWL